MRPYEDLDDPCKDVARDLWFVVFRTWARNSVFRNVISDLSKECCILHPCIETLNSRNLGLAKDSFKVSFGFRTLWRPRLIKDPKNVKNHWFYSVPYVNED